MDKGTPKASNFNPVAGSIADILPVFRLSLGIHRPIENLAT